MSQVLQSKILYDDRFCKYYNLFTETKVVHKPFLKDYLNEIIPDDDTIFHLIVHDSKDDDGKNYLSDVKDMINKENIVLHVISPRSYYKLPNCPHINYYVEMIKGSRSMVQKLSSLVENDENKERIMINLLQDINSIVLNYQTPSGKVF